MKLVNFTQSLKYCWCGVILIFNFMSKKDKIKSKCICNVVLLACITPTPIAIHLCMNYRANKWLMISRRGGEGKSDAASCFWRAWTVCHQPRRIWWRELCSRVGAAAAVDSTPEEWLNARYVSCQKIYWLTEIFQKLGWGSMVCWTNGRSSRSTEFHVRDYTPGRTSCSR